MSTIDARQVVAPQTRGQGALKAGAFFLVVALAVFGFGARAQSFVDRYDPNVVYCGDDVMTRDHVCLDFGGDGGGEYNEVRAQQEANYLVNQRIASISPMVAIGLGALAVLLFVVGFAKRSRRPTSPDLAA